MKLAIGIAGIGAISVVVACSAAEEQRETTAASATVARKVDASLMPFLNVDLVVDSSVPSAGMFEPVGAQLLALGRDLGSDAALGGAEAINVMVRARDGAAWMHMTLPAADLQKAAAASSLPGKALNLGREIGFNDIAAERAAGDYCGPAKTGFCATVGG